MLAGISGCVDWKCLADGCGRVGEVEPITVRRSWPTRRRLCWAACNRPRSGPAVQVKFADTGRTVKGWRSAARAEEDVRGCPCRGADCLLTGEANHHAAIDAVSGAVAGMAVGHYATESWRCVPPFPPTVFAALRSRS